MQFWKIFSFILQLAPMVIGLVRQIEVAMPGSGLGSSKLQLLQGIVQTAADAEPEISSAISSGALSDVVASIAKTTVATLNAAGVFKTSTVAP